MYASLVPRQVKIGDAAAFVGTTPRAIRHYHQIGLLPEPLRGPDGHRRYGYDDVIRLLWIRRMSDAGIALADIGNVGTGNVGTGNVGTDGGEDGGDDGDRSVLAVLDRLEQTLAARQEELRRQQAAVRRMRTRGSRAGLLSDVVAERLRRLPEDSVRQADLDGLVVVEQVFGPLGAAVHASRLLALAARPDLRAESDRVDAAEEALDDTVAVDDPRVTAAAAARHAFEQALHVAIEESGLAEEEAALLEAADAEPGSSGRSTSAAEAVARMPYDFSPARLRCLELADALAGRDATPSPPG